MAERLLVNVSKQTNKATTTTIKSSAQEFMFKNNFFSLKELKIEECRHRDMYTFYRTQASKKQQQRLQTKVKMTKPFLLLTLLGVIATGKYC